MHKTLERQIIRLYDALENFPAEHKDLLQVISKTYADNNREHALIERSLEISSKELTEANERLRQEIVAAIDRAEKLEKLNDIMIDREIKMVELKKDIKKLTQELHTQEK